jgi:hypothetical protein
VNAFKSGVTAWSTALREVGISTSFSSSSPDVRVHWLSASEMKNETGSANVLGFASTTKNIYMLKENVTESTVEAVATHEFGHMLGIWSHSFTSNLMSPYLKATNLSNQDKRTLADFL